jgi:hypothetical protein
MSAYGQVGKANGWPVSRHEPLHTTPPPSREIGQKGDILANLMLHVFIYCWFEMTWKQLKPYPANVENMVSS